MSEKLKPCPFCGGEPEMEPTGKHKTGRRGVYGYGMRIKCTSCHVQREQAVITHSLEWLQEKMTDHWNRRHQEQDSPSEFERCMNK